MGITIKLLVMKKLIFTLFIFSAMISTTTGQDTTLVEQYCNLIVTGKMFSNKVHIVIDFGNEEKKWHQDYRLKDEQTGKPKEFKTVIDALNYMGLRGWTLLNAFPMSEGGATASHVGTSMFYYYFKKLFKKSEIN